MFNLGFSFNTNSETGVWIIISAVVAVIGGIVLFFTFLKKGNNGVFKGFKGWLYDFLSFKKMLVENLLRILYLITAIFITLSSFAMIRFSFLGFLGELVLGNVALRIAYELLLLLFTLVKNTTEINSKMDKKLTSRDNDTEQR